MESVEKAVAKSLLGIKAVMLRPESPFTWASGWKSPIYCDNRRLLSYPENRENVCRWMADITQMHQFTTLIPFHCKWNQKRDQLWLTGYNSPQTDRILLVQSSTEF